MTVFDETRAAALEALLAKATPGPWRAVVEGGQPAYYYHALICIAADTDGSGYVSVVQDGERPCLSAEWVPNAKAIAALRNDAPDLLAAWRAAEAERDVAMAALKELYDRAEQSWGRWAEEGHAAEMDELGHAVAKAGDVLKGGAESIRTAKTLPPEPGDDDPLVKALRALPKPHGRADWQERVLKGIDEEDAKRGGA